MLLFLRATGLLETLRGKAVLHFAPERRLSVLLQHAELSAYVKADLFPSAADVMRVDMLAIPFSDQSFDLVIANHVLEHVSDDGKALSEIHRVLRVGGHAILQTPYCPRLTRTWEDEGIASEDARLLAFGQEDHVRIYGRDIFDRFVAAGFISLVRTHDELLPGSDAAYLGVNAREPFFLFRRTS